MTMLLYASEELSAVLAEQPLIKAKDMRAMQSSMALLSEATALRNDAATAREEAVRQGRAEGLEQARSEIANMLADEIATLANRIAASEADVRSDIAAMTHRALSEILGLMSEEDKISAITERALSRLEMSEVEAIEVHPDAAAAMHDKLAPEAAALLRPDPALGMSDCVIRAHSGTIIASLDVQLAALAQRWGITGDMP